MQTQTQTVIGETQYRGKTATHWHITDTYGMIADGYGYQSNGIGYTYGAVNVAPSPNETYYDPPLAVPLSLALNQPYTFSFTGHFVAPGIAEIKTDVTQTMTYNGRENVTTAFGTFETCKFTYQLAGQSGSRNNWIVASGKLQGLAVQSRDNNTLTQPSNITVSW